LAIIVTEKEVEDRPEDLASITAHSYNSQSDVSSGHIEQEIAVEETIVLEEKPHKPWRTMLSGLPSPSSTLWSLATLALNAGLFLAVSNVWGFTWLA